MSFTDQNLKDAKDHIEACGSYCQTCLEMKIPSLIARLEAAELIAEAYAEANPEVHAVKLWLKTCGK